MSKWFPIALGFCALAALGPNPAWTSPSSDNAPVMKADDGPKRPGLPIEGVVTNPDWISRPSGDDVARFYPILAMRVGLSGRAELHCAVSALGMMERCKVGEELPVGLGFGAAAIRMAALFRMRPKTLDGVPVGGSEVNIPIRFLMPAPPPPSSPESDGASPKALELARQLAVAMHGMSDADYVDNYVVWFEGGTDAAESSPDLDETSRQAVLDALKKAIQVELPQIVDATASALVAAYSEEDLTKIVDFAESPAGRAWFSKQIDMQTHAKAAFSTVWWKIREDAASRFCAQTSCPPPPAAPVAGS